jgi:hypothetical protein
MADVACQWLANYPIAMLASPCWEEGAMVDPIARAKDVSNALAEFKSHQDWEVEHPGRLWDEPKQKVPN